jgi:glyoxylase-like metal-dependent hydrolase (beta-lactamase superfamily II)/rhodanese-related sulfurtransferase
VIFKQFYLGCLAHASYLVGDAASKTAAVIDPQRDIDQYVAFAGERGLTIRHVVLTHFHADFVAGHLELRDRTGARIYLGAAARAEYAFTPLADGDVIEFGRVRLRALETPGHTVESISILVYDLDAGAAPQAVLTGDTLFVGDVGRPDLRVALGWPAVRLGEMLYDSIQTKLLPLPDATMVYPAHGAGSLCGRALSRETASTIGEQRGSNYALQPMPKDEFVKLVTIDQPDAPPYFTFDAVLNTKERPTLGETLERELQAVPLDRVLALQAVGAEVLDTRDPADFAAAHLTGSINIGLGGQYATWAGTVLDRDRPIVIVADPGREEESAVRLGRIGFDQLVGYLQDGMLSLRSRPDLTTSTLRLSAPVASARLQGASPPLLIDVRSPAEYAAGHLAGSLALPLSRLAAALPTLPRDRPALVYCASGYRSSIAASVLQRVGVADVTEIAAGINGWTAAGLPVVESNGREAVQ